MAHRRAVHDRELAGEFLAIGPTNHKLFATDPAGTGPDTRALIVKWGSLYRIRTTLGCAACLSFLWASVA